MQTCAECRNLNQVLRYACHIFYLHSPVHLSISHLKVKGRDGEVTEECTSSWEAITKRVMVP